AAGPAPAPAAAGSASASPSAGCRKRSAIRSGRARRARWRGWYSFDRSSRSSQPPQGAVEIPGDLLERQGQCGAPPDQHIVLAGGKPSRQPPPSLDATTHPIALDCRPDLPRYREADADRTAVAPLARLQRERRGRYLDPTGGRQEVGASPEPLHDRVTAGVRR